ncbi:hypothetical protein Nepgr_033350 [Nepenthes gracilis]|uniref:Uncharacterized protein n=1 Tax=Nepenthes gracilis TaxID=150966 RepID=A0AAD3TL96_NEPGR|nr:hypothetical protein Nepgr_033350 [Nepenthes gracilis]
MALQTADPPITHSAQTVANAFVEQYYQILYHSPELVYRFYQDSSVLSRQEENGEMTSVTTMQGIKDKILSVDCKNYMAEIETADAQKSYKDGVIVLVTGCLTGKNNLRRKFAQSFFLAPQVKGYFVLNDVFRYVDETEPLDGIAVTSNKIDDSAADPLTLDPEPSYASDRPWPDVATSNDEDNRIHVEKECEPLDNEIKSGFGNEAHVDPHPNENHISAATDSSHSSAQEDGWKKSYASIVRVVNCSGLTKISVPNNTVRSVPSSTENQPSDSVAPGSAPELSVQIGSRAFKSGNTQEDVEGHSIYVRNLPLNVTVSQLEAKFEKFGPIKQGGVQVRSNRQHGSCYGFVEFLSVHSMDSAIQASPITIGGRPAVVEIKRSTARVDGGRGRFPSVRGGFRNDSIRGGGGFSGSRSFRTDGSRWDYSGRGRGAAGRGGEGYPRGRGRAVLPPSGSNRHAVWRFPEQSGLVH